MMGSLQTVVGEPVHRAKVSTRTGITALNEAHLGKTGSLFS